MNRFDLIDLLSQYCNENENLLVARQTPILDDEGNLQLYSDGAIKATWPCQIPSIRSKTWREEGAWYTHVAIFAGLRATTDNAVGCHLLVLDDVGTKSKTPPIRPSYIIETSPGNFQWGYLLRSVVSTEVYAAAIKAMARCGYTDPGAINPVRKVRLPGSINLKPKARGFVAVVTHFEDISFELADLLTACGVTVTDADRAGTKRIDSLRLKDDGMDSVLAWLSGHQQVFSGASSDGWYDVLCPNYAEHTDGAPTGRYSPVNRAYKCFHGHCQHITSSAYLKCISAAGGPTVQTGIREELLVAPIAAATKTMNAVRDEIEKSQGVPMFAAEKDASEEVKKVIADNDKRSARDVLRNSWFKRYAYHKPDDSYFDMERRSETSRSAFDAEYRHVGCNSRHGKWPVISASRWFDENRDGANAHIIDGLVYAAGEPVLVSRDDYVYGNLWRDARQVGKDGPVKPWLDHLERVLPSKTERDMLLDWMAFKVQYPKEKINWQIYWGSEQGVGKDTAIEPFLYAIGGHRDKRKNVAIVSLKELVAEWGYHLSSEVIVVNEVRESGGRQRREMENSLKPLCAAPPAVLSVNRKGLHPVEVPNRMSLIAMSNYRDGITLPREDRRWAVLWSTCGKMLDELGPDAGKKMWRWLDNGGNDACAVFLRERDVSQFNAQSEAPWTDAKTIMCNESLSDGEEYCHALAEQRIGGFESGILASPFTDLVDNIQLRAPGGLRINKYNVAYALKHAGWKDKGICSGRAKDGTPLSPKRIFTAPGAHVGEPNATLRRILHEIENPPPRMHAVK